MTSTDASTTVLLTDDEVVALALRSGTIWRAPLPTVGDSEEELTRAAARGWRALLVRELVVDRDNAAPELHDVLAAQEAKIIARTFVADGNGVPLDGASWSTYYQLSGSQALIEVISSEGVHSFTSASLDQCSTLIGAAVEAVRSAGLPEAAESAARFCVIAPGQPARVLTVSKGAMQLTEEDPDGARRELPAPGSASAAVAGILGLAS